MKTKSKPSAGRSPIAQRPLPQPGESLSVQLDLLLSETIEYWLLMMIVSFVLAGLEWCRWYFRWPPSPGIYTGAFVLLSGLGLWRIRRALPKVKQLRLGIKGERTVGQLLETLRANGYRVFHDVEEDGYNIDHVLIGPRGVFAIETKTRTKPAKGKPEVIFDGQKILVNGFEPDRDPVVQAKASARRIKAILKEMTGEDVFVTPVVLFPGWHVVSRVKQGQIVVANADYFAKWTDPASRRTVLDREKINHLSAGMDRYLRSD